MTNYTPNTQTAPAKPPLPVLLGPTAVGKTALAVELAARLDAEIISGDSMQFYRWLDVGTAKIRPAEMLTASGRLAPHHLIDICDPDEPYSAADFQRDAAKLIAEIYARGRLPLLVGGTALYIQALADNYSLNGAAPADESLRRRLHEEYQRLGAAAMHRKLAAADPDAAAKISPNDEKRLVRALEFWQLCGRPISAQGKTAEPAYDVLLLGLRRERGELYQRIDQRVDEMLAAGLLAETARLLAAGVPADCKPMQGLGYRQAVWYFAGLVNQAEMARLIKRDTRHFAKRQLTWWRRDPRIHWFDVPPGQSSVSQLEPILRLVRAHFSANPCTPNAPGQ